jgi:gag-polypeptide of LTR copia-type
MEAKNQGVNDNMVARGRCIFCPPMFNGEKHFLWKVLMRVFIQASNFDVWLIIQNGPLEVPKEEERWDAKDKEKAQLNFKAKNTLLGALSQDVFNQVSSCKNAKEIWDMIEEIYGANNPGESICPSNDE